MLKSKIPYVLRGVTKHNNKNTLTNCAKSDILTQRLVLLRVVWDESI